ncbi:DUF6150 family protein [Reichenbachiella versicolor]|uniref:DUF6150 family protein n=1 Tax=Reichenbachiella versicolor TaxID=1821036 RepID=UPI000D6E8243|nr:DUF6150 family protein [Reichenbachiella versicolor]
MISLILSFWLHFIVPNAAIDPCKVYGQIYEVELEGMADYIVYIEDSEYSADLVVYEHENSLYADHPGQWHFVENKRFANAYVYFTKRKNMADFIIAFTDTESFAGCNR